MLYQGEDVPAVVILSRNINFSLLSCTLRHLRDKGSRFNANEVRSEELGEWVHRAIGLYRDADQVREASHSSEVGFRAKVFDARESMKPEGYEAMFWREVMTDDV